MFQAKQSRKEKSEKQNKNKSQGRKWSEVGPIVDLQPEEDGHGRTGAEVKAELIGAEREVRRFLF
jgi:hypothetical protein